MQNHGTAYTLSQYTEALVALQRALPKALQGTNPKNLLPLLQKNGERIEGSLGQLFRSLEESTSQVVTMPASGVKLPLLEEIGTVRIPATAERFLARERFVLNYGSNAEPGVLISYLGDNFKEWFLDKVEVPLTQETTLRYAKLVKSSVDGPILAELGDKAETTLAQIWHLMTLQPNGEEGVLLTNGWANIFYVDGRAVLVSWRGDGWFVFARSVAGPSGWSGGRRVFSRNS